jgi:hydrogenase maturation protein HypF
LTARRVRLTLSGAVQGVGFRPFIYRLARSLSLGGWIVNAPHGVIIELEGAPEALEMFLARLPHEKPAHALITALERQDLPLCGETTFEIRHSQAEGAPTALILPDLATCADCLRELFDPSDRRYRYPFINCTHCGPRYSIILSLPYDRPNTTMRAFALCPACQREYADPLDRRFHAQPTACPSCGPRLEAWSAQGDVLAHGEEALQRAEDALRGGQIVALKGLGGFQLLCDARDGQAVRTLRARKHRPEKPFAIMLPDLEIARRLCHVDAQEASLLTAPAAPIVLLRRRADALAEVADEIAPHNPHLGVMLPYTPLHHLLMRDLGFPVVATSGNISGEPICTDEYEALARLRGIADLFLVHNRPIARPVDDSVVCTALGEPLILRRARGYAPSPLPLPSGAPLPPLIALGAHQKNTLAIAEGQRVILSQHIGDLENAESERVFKQTLGDLAQMHAVQPQLIVCDAHPDYLSTQYAEQLAAERGVPVLRVQHHYAHALACMAENAIAPPFLAVTWDGTGYGADGTIWGGEFFQVTAQGFRRVGTWRTFPLIGGEAAAREPRRSALGALWQMYSGSLPSAVRDLPPLRAFSAAELRLLEQALARGVNAPLTSSVGRLFDAVASLLDLNQRMSFEGQAAMRLEFAALSAAQTTDESYPFEVTTITTANGEAVRIIDYAQVFEAIMDEWRQGVSAADIAQRFHQTLCAAIVAQARAAALERVALCGGCFQNRFLLTGAVAALQRAGFAPFWSRQVPPNDGGIAYGQAIAARRSSGEKE